MAQTITVDRFLRGGKIPDNAQAARVISNVLDFKLLNAAANEVIAALQLEPGTVVLTCGIKCLRAEGGTATVEVGDLTAEDTYLTAADVNATTTELGDALAAPIYYKATDYIALKANAALANAKVYVWALVANVFGAC